MNAARVFNVFLSFNRFKLIYKKLKTLTNNFSYDNMATKSVSLTSMTKQNNSSASGNSNLYRICLFLQYTLYEYVWLGLLVLVNVKITE